MSFFENHYKEIGIDPPICHFVLGSGFSDHLDKIKVMNLFQNWEERQALSFSSVPNLPSPTVPSHAGTYRFFVYQGGRQALSFQCGRLHLYEGFSARTVAEPVLQILSAGTKQFVLSNISGSLKKEFGPGHIIALKDHINMTGQSPFVGPEKTDEKGQKIGLRFPDMSGVYNSQMREQVARELIEKGVRVTPGIYVGLLGPELETPAQIEWLNRSSGGCFSVVGMSTVIESIALKGSGADLAGFSLVSNLAAGIDPQGKELSFKEMCESIEPYVLKILQAFFSYGEKLLK